MGVEWPLTKDQANHIVDVLLHPKFKDGKEYVLLDEVLHIAIEGNPKRALRRSLYTLSRFLLQP